MVRWLFPLIYIFLLPACTHFQSRGLASIENPNDMSTKGRIDTRTFPSIFQAWAPAQNLNETIIDGQAILPTSLSTIESATHHARHDLVWQGPTSFHLQWNNQTNIGLATGFTMSSIAQAVKLRSELLSINPHIVLLSEIRYHDGPEGYIPRDKYTLVDARFARQQDSSEKNGSRNLVSSRL